MRNKNRERRNGLRRKKGKTESTRNVTLREKREFQEDRKIKRENIPTGRTPEEI